MFVYIRFSKLNIQIRDQLKFMESSVFQLSLSGFHSVNPSLTKHVLFVRMGYKIDGFDMINLSIKQQSTQYRSGRLKIFFCIFFLRSLLY